MGEIVSLAEHYKNQYRAAVLAEFEANCAAHENDDLSLVETLSRDAWASTQDVNMAFGRWLTQLGTKSGELVHEIQRVMAALEAEEDAVKRGDS